MYYQVVVVITDDTTMTVKLHGDFMQMAVAMQQQDLKEAVAARNSGLRRRFGVEAYKSCSVRLRNHEGSVRA